LNILERMVTHWNGFRVWFPPPIEHSGEDGYALEWVGFGSLLPLNILERVVTYWNGFGSLPNWTFWTCWLCTGMGLGFGSLLPVNILERMVTYWNGFVFHLWPILSA
jgi:hypothetical protein